MFVYYFTSEQHAVSNIALRRIKVTDISKSNDPFEFWSFKDVKSGDLNSVQNSISSIRERFVATRGIICFTRGWDNPLMWAHYSDNHKGICLGFKVSEDFAQEVNYRSDRKAYDENKNISWENFVKLCIFSKFENWKYENEWRHVVDLREAIKFGDLHFLEFGESLKLSRVILGYKCGIDPQEMINMLASIGYDDVKVFKAFPSRLTYRIRRKEHGKSSTAGSLTY